ncbi:MAG: MFS transporter [Calditrichaeota bacterium]|nr:MAG: MFS transporter [Calditrichota bacterium]
MVERIINFVRQYDRNLWALSFGWFVGALGFAVAIPFISIYFHSELGLSLSQIGLFFGFMALVRSLFQLVGGEVADRYERKQLLVYTQILRAITFIGIAISIYMDWGFWAIAASLTINSIFGAMFHPAANAMVSDVLSKEKRLEGFAITRASGNLGWAAGPALGGFMAEFSYGHLFIAASIITFVSGFVFAFFLHPPKINAIDERFKFKDLIAIKDDPNLAAHSILIFVLYIVVAQLIAPFSVYSVEIAGISEVELGLIYTINGLMVVSLQLLVTKLLSNFKFTSQLALGGLIYAIGYGLVGCFSTLEMFILVIMFITFGEMVMSPPSLALTSKLAPEGRMGRYMGIFGFFVASGWSFGPLYGGFILDQFKTEPVKAWILISFLGLVSAIGYLWLSRRLPPEINKRD